LTRRLLTRLTRLAGLTLLASLSLLALLTLLPRLVALARLLVLILRRLLIHFPGSLLRLRLCFVELLYLFGFVRHLRKLIASLLTRRLTLPGLARFLLIRSLLRTRRFFLLRLLAL